MNRKCEVRRKPRKSSGCSSRQELELVQSFPSNGSLAARVNTPLEVVQRRLADQLGQTYSYVLSTVQWSEQKDTFEQHGSAPNFQGSVLTLCTCKHQMRSRRSVADWPGVWLAGFTSRTIYGGKHWLFYLAKVAAAYESHADLWNDLTKGTRQAKAAHRNFLGDIFEPKHPPRAGDQRFSPPRYFKPARHAHRQHQNDKTWERDINYKHTVSSQRAPLLVAEPKLTFLWREPLIYLDQNHCRDFHRWESLADVLSVLRPGKS